MLLHVVDHDREGQLTANPWNTSQALVRFRQSAEKVYTQYSQEGRCRIPVEIHTTSSPSVFFTHSHRSAPTTAFCFAEMLPPWPRFLMILTCVAAAVP